MAGRVRAGRRLNRAGAGNSGRVRGLAMMLVFLLGLFLTLAGIHQYLFLRAMGGLLETRGREARGVVAATSVERGGRETRCLVSYVFTAPGPGGEPVRISRAGERVPAGVYHMFSPGRSVPVLFSPGNPRFARLKWAYDARTGTEGGSLVLLISLLGVGLMFLALKRIGRETVLVGRRPPAAPPSVPGPTTDGEPRE